ncbi:MAG TPA: glucose 1-dehydrogenase [Cyclobacteriaceae bacterium]|nr:glucose 1-dehydrogenase [Cyclobacteriaceae bacterium]
MQKGGKEKKVRKAQAQRRPGSEKALKPEPVSEDNRPGSGKLLNKVALITGGDSGIGRAVAILFAKEGARVAIAYLNEHTDARETQQRVAAYNECIIIPGDLSNQNHCRKVVDKVIKAFGKIDILVNNAGLHWEQTDFLAISSDQLVKTFKNNVFPFFWVTQAALPNMKKGSAIINTASVTAYRGSGSLIDYAVTKGAIVSFTRSLAGNLADKGIRVNGVAPGPIWTPLIASSFKPGKVAKFGSDVPLKRAGEPIEVATAYLFLASDDSTYYTGQFLHPNGGEIVNG